MKEIHGKRLLVIDDESQMCYLLKLIFGGAGAEVYTATDGKQGLDTLVKQGPDLILLDIMMPGMDGFETCRQIRQISSVPVIMLTVLSREEDIVRGLRAGADDYVTKPFDRDFLMDRVATALRRVDQNNRSSSLSTYQDGYLTIDPVERQVAVRGEPVQLSFTEFRLLTYLIRNSDREMTYNQILKNVWGEVAVNNSYYVHSYIWRLRKKLEEDPTSPLYLVSGQVNSYRFVKRSKPQLA